MPETTETEKSHRIVRLTGASFLEDRQVYEYAPETASVLEDRQV
tara:strand:- start:619 stop:750 length:132 start_codon:yes stop_codon:yes gene_type:complete